MSILTQQQLEEIDNSVFQLYTPKEYLQIDIMNNFGFDKLNYSERLVKFREYFPDDDQLKSMKPEDIKDHIKDWKLEDKVLAFAGLLAYIDTLNNRPTGYCVSFDSVASGTQLMAALTGDIAGLYYCGALGNSRNDIYTKMGEIYTEISGLKIEIADSSDIRKKLKECLMTFNYGSIAKPKEILGKDNVKYFHNATKLFIPNVYALRNILVDNWDSTKDVQSWVLPDRHTAYIPVMQLQKHTVVLGGMELSFKTYEQMPSEHELSNCAKQHWHFM